MNGGTTNETLEQHLLFHKALIDDNVASEKIDRYLNILNEAPDCERMQDPVDESIRTVFRLVLEHENAFLDSLEDSDFISDVIVTPAPEETKAIMDWITELEMDPDLVVRAYEYAKQRGATSHRYVGKVLMGWAENGIHTRRDADEYLSERDERHFVYRRIMQALGFSRNVTEEEARLIDEWVDELDCEMSQIMDACAKTAGIGNPNIKYVDAVLRNSRGGNKSQSGQQEVPRNRVLAYYAHLREEAEQRAEMARQEVYAKVPQIRQMDEQIQAASREMTNVMVRGGADKLDRIRGLRAQLTQAEEARTRLLTEHGVPIDYMNVRYRCPRCGDTGVLDNGARCDCYLEVVKEAANWHEEEK